MCPSDSGHLSPDTSGLTNPTNPNTLGSEARQTSTNYTNKTTITHPSQSRDGPDAQGPGLSAALSSLPLDPSHNGDRTCDHCVSPHFTEASDDPVGTAANLHSITRIDPVTLGGDGTRYGRDASVEYPKACALEECATSKRSYPQGVPIRGVKPIDRGVKGLDYSGRTEKCISEVCKEFKQWREAHTVHKAREAFASSLPKYSVFEQATGGCLDALALAFANF